MTNQEKQKLEQELINQNQQIEKLEEDLWQTKFALGTQIKKLYLNMTLITIILSIAFIIACGALLLLIFEK